MKMRFSGIMPQGIEKLFVRDDLRSVMAEFGSYTAHAFERGRRSHGGVDPAPARDGRGADGVEQPAPAARHPAR